MSKHPEGEDTLSVRGLLAESGVEESPELVEGLLALRQQSSTAAPEPTGELAALLAGTPIPLRPRPKRGRGMILGVALVGAMAVGAGGVAAHPDFLVRADPAPSVSFTPEAPEPQRSTPAPSVPEETPVPAAPAAATVPAPAAPEAVPAPVPAPVAEPAPAAPAPAVTPGYPHGFSPGNNPGDRGVPGPSIGYIPPENRRADGLVRDTMGPGGGAALYGGGAASYGGGAASYGGRENQRSNGRDNFDQNRSGGSHWDR